MKIVVISAAMLRAADACLPQVNLFEHKFGGRLVFNSRKALIEQAKRHAEDFDFAWALRGLIKTPKAKKAELKIRHRMYRECKRLDFIESCTLGLLGYGWVAAESTKANKRFRRRNAVAFAKLLWEEA